MNQTNTSSRSRNVPLLLVYLVPIILLMIAAAYFRQSHLQSKDRLEALSVQNSQLQKELAEAKTEIDQLSSGDSSRETRERLERQRRNAQPEPVVPETETLFLQKPVVEQTAEGLLVRLSYQPEEGTELPDTTTIVFRVPGSGAAQIVSLKAAGSDARPIINPARTLAMIECSPSEMNSLGFEFKVSEPVTATVRGSEGIIDFELDITPEGCSVRKL